MGRFRKRSITKDEYVNGQHRFEHWYRDNTVYFITARCRDRYPAFQSDEAKLVFRDRFDHYTKQFGFVPWIATLMNNHYHFEGYLKVGENLGPMMQRIHGSVAKLVNDLLPERRVPFWWEHGRRDYFDGCLRDGLQGRRAYRYTWRQSVRAGLCRDPQDYPHTRVYIDLDRAIARALELNAFMEGVPYLRYERGR
jgi:REP element-mobilizing transposase RayT